MKNVMVKIPIWLLIAWPYVFLASLFLNGGSFFGITFILTFVLCIYNAINAWTYKGDNIAKELGLWGMITKLVHMPYYVVVFVMGAIGMLSLYAGQTMGGAPVALLLMLITGIVLMLASSFYCLKAVLAARDNGVVKKESAMLLGTTSFIMFIDVICAILIYNKIKKNKKIEKRC